MDNTATAPAATSAVAPSPAPTMTPPQVMTTPPATAANGAEVPAGSVQDSLKKAISNPLQLGFGIITTAALFYAIYYFQYNIRFSKTFVKTMENKIDELDMKYADVVSKLNKQNTPQEDILQAFI